MKLTLIYGGKSPEHEISVLTAASVMRHLDYSEHVVLPVYINPQGQWIAGTECHEPLSNDTTLYMEASDTVEYRSSTQYETSLGRAVVPSDVLSPETLAFPVLHGPNGEDGTIQGLFETLEVPYVGCGVLASAAGMDKIVSKRLFREAQIPQVPFTWIRRYQWENEQEKTLQRIEGELVYPLFVKPANMGSSVGISYADNREALLVAIEKAFRYDRRLIIEQGVNAREVELAVMGNDDPVVSVPGELVKQQAFYDYDSKYINNTVEMQIPAELSEDMKEQLQHYARQAYLALDCAGLTRCDFFVTYNNDIYLNEVNTLPGFTQFSMFPSLWEATGKSYAEILRELIDLAMERYQEREALALEGNE
ncbi:MAG: D-alanine--D-alanine ligase [Aerococcus sp.]|nr:D-alanine--D-alanine ligase [Aerococcus sp.]